MMDLSIAYMQSPVGILRLQGLAGALLRIDYVDAIENDAQHEETLLQAKWQLEEYFEGKRTTFGLSIHAVGTHFQQNVWDEIKRIPYGTTWSYEWLARNLGDIKVIRAAASANGRNPLPIVIPCHRIIGKSGALTGYSGGLHRKKWLLDFEQRDSQPKLL
jgi:methylated-DNA-[protein]-cysteine S-methyltransferase